MSADPRPCDLSIVACVPTNHLCMMPDRIVPMVHASVGVGEYISLGVGFRNISLYTPTGKYERSYTLCRGSYNLPML